ncbi:MAG TPA: GxxExxY protein [Gemmatimonadaceae bacterium]|jgi:iron complex transport system substrate-binding protein|nr:GxxExxY protein [Gemmatimonadaceae bacterium]
MREPDDITGQIIDAALRIHRRTGPGLLESVYETLVAAELRRRGFTVERQKAASLEFDGFHFEQALRLDLLVERTVAVEIKSVEQLKPVHKAQLLTYVRLLDLPVGLLINFGGAALKDGLVRVVNDLPHSPTRRIHIDRLAAGSES